VISRALFFFIVAFWIAMNFLLWRMEYGSRGGEISVPADLIWRKILTAPDASSLNVYQNGRRTGFCEFSTSVEQEMAELDTDNPPPEGFVKRAGYQIRLNGNVSLGNFTNRVRFDGRLQFFSNRDWRELNLKISTRAATVEIHSLATNQTVHLKIATDNAVIERDLAFADLQNPDALLRAFAGNFGGGFAGQLELPVVPQTSAALRQNFHWEARREHMKIGGEMVSVYCLETHMLQNRVVIYVSTIGEILRVELPGGVVATIDEWSKS
jgi:hypothetical protein